MDQDPRPTASQRYKVHKVLGKGGFAQVYLATDLQTGRQVAIKVLKQSSCNRYVLTELLNHRQLRHPHVIVFERVFVSKNSVNVVMEYANGGSLLQYVMDQGGKLQEQMARWLFQQLILAVDYCHRMGVSNRDIKLENILLQVLPDLPRPLIKLCDFGYSKSLLALPQTGVGTLHYMAPEVLSNYVHNTRLHYDAAAADIWSCGVALYAMLVGHYPFNIDPTVQDRHNSSLSPALQHMQEQSFYMPTDITPACSALLTGMLHPDSQQRYSMAQIMSDPWFLQELPPAALTMNDTHVAASSAASPGLLQRGQCSQRQQGSSSLHDAERQQPVSQPQLLPAPPSPPPQQQQQSAVEIEMLISAVLRAQQVPQLEAITKTG